MKKTLNILKIAAPTILVALAVTYVSAQSSGWTAPTQPPPGGNVPAPINVGSSTQSKLGALRLNTSLTNPATYGLDVFGKSRFFGDVSLSGKIGTSGASPECPSGSGWGCGVHTWDVWADSAVRTNMLCLGGGQGGSNNAGDCRTSWDGMGMPSGAVMHFNLSACPSGWFELTYARGRYLVGLPGGGNLGWTVGTPLSNLENRPTGGHYHVGAQGVNGWSPTVDQIFPQGGSGTWNATVSNHGSDTGPALPAPIYTVAGTNAPYIQLLVCQKY